MLLLTCKAHHYTVGGWPSPHIHEVGNERGVAMSGYDVIIMVIEAIRAVSSLISMIIDLADRFSQENSRRA